MTDTAPLRSVNEHLSRIAMHTSETIQAIQSMRQAHPSSAPDAYLQPLRDLFAFCVARAGLQDSPAEVSQVTSPEGISGHCIQVATCADATLEAIRAMHEQFPDESPQAWGDYLVELHKHCSEWAVRFARPEPVMTPLNSSALVRALVGDPLRPLRASREELPGIPISESWTHERPMYKAGYPGPSADILGNVGSVYIGQSGAEGAGGESRDDEVLTPKLPPIIWKDHEPPK